MAYSKRELGTSELYFMNGLYATSANYWGIDVVATTSKIRVGDAYNSGQYVATSVTMVVKYR